MVSANLNLLLESWIDLKFGIENSVPFGDHWVHLIVGALAFFVAAGAMRKPLSSWQPWIVVFMLATLNEIVDLSVQLWRGWPGNYGDSLADLAMTIVAPTVLLLVTRLFVRRRFEAAESP